MGKIIAIGGGEIRGLETLPIDKEIVALTKKEHPKALFIPTASNDAEGYWETFQKVYGEELGCRTEVLYLIKQNPGEKEIRDRILGADLIYVGGGETGKMLAIWKEKGVNRYLKEAFAEGIVLSGLSAGSICWFTDGHSEASNTSRANDALNYKKISGLGLIKAFHCPHYNENDRGLSFHRMIENTEEIGIAIEDNCAIAFVEDQYRVLYSDEKARACKVYREQGQVIVEELAKDNHFRDSFALFSL